jgi:hypothetical protein
VNTLVALALIACRSDAPPGKLELVDATPAADLVPGIAAQVARATADHKRLLVYVGASWCEPCGHFHDAAIAGKLDATFGDVRLLVFDADRDNDALERAGYKYELIPLFAIPRADGSASGKQIEGSIKGVDAIAEISPRLRALLDGN